MLSCVDWLAMWADVKRQHHKRLVALQAAAPHAVVDGLAADACCEAGLLLYSAHLFL